MATLATNVTWGSGPTNTFDFSYEKKREGSSQYYKITVVCDPLTGGSYFGYPIYLEIKLDGTTKTTHTLKNASPSQWSTALTYTTGWLEVQNKTSGTTTLAIRVYSGMGSTRNSTYTYSLPIDPAASKISATDANIESTSSISVTKYDSKFTTTVSYKASGQSDYTELWVKQAYTSYGWTIPSSLYSLIKNAKKIDITLQCQTYNGSTLIGTETCTLTATTSESRCKPSVSVTAEEENAAVLAITGSKKIIVVGYSDIRVKTTAEANNSAEISDISLTCGTAHLKGTDVLFKAAKSGIIKVKVTDSRGYSNEEAKSLTAINYIAPTIVEEIYRESSTSDIVHITAKGKWYNGDIGASKNTLKVQVRYKPKSQESYTDADKYTDMTVTTDGHTYTASVTLTGLVYNQPYSIRIRASDLLHEYEGPIAEPIYRNTEISKGIPVFDWGEDDFKFNVPVILENGAFAIGAFQAGLKIWSGTVAILPSAADTVTSKEISFPKGLFTSTPCVCVTPSSSVPDRVSCSCVPTAEGVTVYMTRTNTTETRFYVIAIGT